VTLPETYRSILPGVVGFMETLIFSPDGAVPLAPRIFATGFVVDPIGIVATNRHVVECFDSIPKNPDTGKPYIAAMLCHYGVNPEGKEFLRWVPIEPKYWTVLESIKPDSGIWHGDDQPDIGFVQLSLRDLPALTLVQHEFYLCPGMDIATAGYPMGTDPLTIMGKINQMEPFLRRGIVSSVYPFSVGHPHGFTIDILQQGGSSGSPIFYADKPEVIGMMSASMIDDDKANTNISLCVPAAQITSALQTFKTDYPPRLDGVRTFAEHLETIPMKTVTGWEVVTQEKR
jgi:hypothetical protein